MRSLEESVTNIHPAQEQAAAAADGRTCVYIPARCNSSRLKDKNIADVCGHPLMAYTIRMARAMTGVDKVYVDTDSEYYASVAREYGADVPFLREPKHAADTSSLSEASNRFFQRIERAGVNVSKRIILMLTSPFRNIHTVNDLLDDLHKHISVKTVSVVNLEMNQLYLEKGSGFVGLETLLSNPCDQYDWIKDLGYFSGIAVDRTGMGQADVYNNFKYAVIQNPIEMVDVDEQEDLNLVRHIIKENIYDFGMSMA